MFRYVYVRFSKRATDHSDRLLFRVTAALITVSFLSDNNRHLRSTSIMYESVFTDRRWHLVACLFALSHQRIQPFKVLIDQDMQAPFQKLVRYFSLPHFTHLD